MIKRIFPLLGCVWLFAVTSANAEVIIVDQGVAPQFDGYVHPALRSLVFVSAETRGQAILPATPGFVTPPPLIYRATGPVLPFYPPATMPGFNRPGNPTNLDMSNYSLARAHAMSQNMYRRDGSPVFFSPNAWLSPYPWVYSPYPPTPPGQNHPSNRDNAIFLLDRAHRFSQDAYRKP